MIDPDNRRWPKFWTWYSAILRRWKWLNIIKILLFKITGAVIIYPI
jgi:Ni,Fe-hydrogenase I cytochrome b subunit